MIPDFLEVGQSKDSDFCEHFSNSQSERKDFRESLVNSQSELEDLHQSVTLGEAIPKHRSDKEIFRDYLLNNQSEQKDLHQSVTLGEAIPQRTLGLKRKVIIRHLVLPGHIDDSKHVIKHVNDCFGDKVRLSIMNQFTPVNKNDDHPNLNRTLTKEEYEEVLDYADSLGIENYFWQEGETCKESFIPNF